MNIISLIVLYLPLLFQLGLAVGLEDITDLLEQHHKHRGNHNHKRQQGTVAIHGVRGNGIHPRLEIRTLEKDHPSQWNLFLLAMKEFKERAQHEKLSYYQIAGIHGVPDEPWDGVAKNPSEKHAVGYCTHNSILFPSWHRPYVALFEQALQKVAMEVAHRFQGSEREMYEEAAKTMRVPFWDWALAPANGENSIPQALTAPRVVLDTPQGRVKTANPLFRYDFHPFNGKVFHRRPWSTWHATLRQPTGFGPDAQSDEQAVIAAANNNRANLKQLVYNMFTKTHSFVKFANAASGGTSSIEAIHNIVHGIIGGGSASQAAGHMTVLWYAAFDPIFWLHHAQVDRLIAMWQHTHPNEWTVPQKASQSTFTIAKGSVQGPDSPLTPFHRNTHGGVWTSNKVRDWQQFGYTYPEFLGKPTAGRTRKVINQRYGSQAVTQASRRDLSIPDLGGLNLGNLLDGLPLPPISQITTPNGNYYEYIANIVAPHNALNGSYGIYVFLGEPPSDVSEWPSAANMVGSNFVFAAPDAADMGAQNVTGSVPLTDALMNLVTQGLVQTLAVEAIVPFLQNSLHWGIAQNGVSIDPSQVPGFQLSVVTAQLTPGATEEDFPTWGPETTLANVTHGKPGGLSIGSLLNGIGSIF